MTAASLLKRVGRHFSICGTNISAALNEETVLCWRDVLVFVFPPARDELGNEGPPISILAMRLHKKRMKHIR